MPTAEEIISALNLEPLDGEGGYFRRTWTVHSKTEVPHSTTIFYLVTPDSFSALHRLTADEVFHFYLGDPCEQIMIDPNGDIATSVLGPDILGGQQVQTVVPQNTWQGTRLLAGGRWALLGTTMTPGFHEDGFELATAEHLKSLPINSAAIVAEYLADGA